MQKKIYITDYNAICNLGGDIDRIFENAIKGDTSFLTLDNSIVKGKEFYLGKISAELPEIKEGNYNLRCNRLLLYLMNSMQKNLDILIKKYGKNRLTGPVDGSFWIKYRLKTGDNFGSPYTSEPYNKAYYERLILSCGYGVYEKYGSNHYIVPYEDDPRLTRCLERVVKKGYIIKSPQKEDFFKALEEIYEMVIRLYSGFPVFKAITKEEFFSIYEKLEKIVDFDMVKLAYYENEPVGFFVAIPDFGRMVSGKINPLDIPKILKIKKSPKCYILLYLGAQSSHRGLGMALAESMRSSLRDKNAQSVGALIREKNLKRSYMDIYTDKSYSYCLYSKEI